MRQNGQEGSMVFCNSRLSLFFLHGFLGEEGPEISYISLFNEGRGGSTLCLRFAHQGKVAPQVSLTCAAPSVPMSDVHRKEICLPWLREPEKVQSYRPVIICFPPRSAEFGLQTDLKLQLP